MRLVRTLVVVLASISSLLSARILAAAAAQCTGVVLDENGVPVSAAQIKLEDTSGRAYRTETDGAGRFTIRDLPAGDYKVEVRKERFFLLRGGTLSLAAGPNEVTFTLNHEQEVHEQVQVTAPANQIDPRDTSQRSTLTARHIRDIPVPNSHVLAKSLIAMPEIVQDHLNNLHVAGARSGETQYLLDGFELGDPVNGALTARFNIDATRAAEVQTGRFGAAYAHSGASILSLETPDGDDRWRFGTTNPAPGINIQQSAHLGNWYPRFTFSGPIERGRFWFSDSISVQHTFAVVKGLPSNGDTFEEWAGDNLFRLQYNVSRRHILHASLLYNRAHDDNLGLDALDHTPQGTQPLVLLVNGTSGNYFARTQQRGRRLQAVGSVTAASRRWHGIHELSAGFNVAGLTYSLAAQRGEIQALRADGTLVRQSIFSGPAAPRASNTQAGGYFQDTWLFSKHFLFHAGVRTDWDRFTQSAMAEPRLSGNVLPFGDDRSKFSLGWGIYNAPLNLSVIAQAFDQQQVDTFYDATGKVVVLGPVQSRFVLPSGGLQQPRFTISSAGWQEKFGKHTLVGLELLARNGDHGFAYVDQQPAQPGGIFLLQDHRKDRYRAATFSMRQVFSEATEVYGA